MLTECINCGFYVRPNDEFCLNCGIESPSKEFTEPSASVFFISSLIRSDFLKIICSMILTLILLLAVADWNFSKIFYLRDIYFFSTIILGLLLSFALLFLLQKWLHAKLKPKRKKKPESFTSKLKLIDKRLSDLERRAKQIDLVLSRIIENKSQQLNEIRPKLLEARKIASNQLARYELQKQKVQLVRLQNGVSPYLAGWNRLNEYETENGLTTIKNTKQKMDKIRQNLAIEFPEKALPEKRHFLSQLDETETSFEQLREALLSRQAARALREISPIEENLQLPNGEEIAHAAETFNVQTTLTNFSESFDELEREYQRLKAEEVIGQKLLES